VKSAGFNSDGVNQGEKTIICAETYALNAIENAKKWR
jgi:hypothetical protein